MLLPIRTVWSLQIPLRQGILVIMLFGCGFVSCGAGIIRTYYTYQVTQTWDQVWASYPVWMTSAIELYIGVVCLGFSNPCMQTPNVQARYAHRSPPVGPSFRSTCRRSSALSPPLITIPDDDPKDAMAKAECSVQGVKRNWWISEQPSGYQTQGLLLRLQRR